MGAGERLGPLGTLGGGGGGGADSPLKLGIVETLPPACLSGVNEDIRTPAGLAG